MGCDGGTIPKRDELVRTKKKPEQKDKNSELAFKWKHCAISQEALIKPIVACELGRLYNKESVLEFLIDRSKFEMASQFDHIRGLKDVRELNLTDNPESKSKNAETGDGFIDPNISNFICPVVGIEMSGKYKFNFLLSCGCVLSDRALREVKTETCHKCGKIFLEQDVVVLNGSDEEVAEMRGKMKERRALAKACKKSKKAEKHKQDSADSAASTSKKAKSSSSTSSSPPTTLDTTSKAMNGNEKNITDKSTDKKRKSAAEKQGKASSLQQDPAVSKIFKSLFTTSEAAQKQKQAHWVTYNPMYY